MSDTPASRRPRNDRLFSQKRLIQAGSIAAALGSILGLAFTVGGGVTHLFGPDHATPRPELHGVAIHRMTLRAYLATRTNPTIDDRPDYTKEEYRRDVLAVDVRATYAHGSTGEHFPVRVTLERLGRNGSADLVTPHLLQYYLEADTDECLCHDRFWVPRRAGKYRAEVEILDPSGRKSELVVDDDVSDWLRI